MRWVRCSRRSGYRRRCRVPREFSVEVESSMVGGKCSRLALLAAMGMFTGMASASAADLGGNCCADLEERVAELEATTARKGNRKVSLTVSGHVNEAVMWF